MPATVVANAAFAAGIRSEFLSIYRRETAALNPVLRQLMRIGLPSDLETETFFFWDSAMHSRHRVKGEPRTSKPFVGTAFTVANRFWTAGVHWIASDLRFEKTGQLRERAMEAGKSLALNPERGFFDLLTGGTAFLPFVPNAADGVAFFDGAARFGIATGNTFGGAGVATANAVRGDIFDAIELIRSFDDTEGQPLYPSDPGPYAVIASIENLQVVNEALVQSPTVGAVGVAGADGIQNVVQAAGLNIQTWFTPRLIGNNDIFVHALGAPTPPTGEIVNLELETIQQLKNQSDDANRNDIEGVWWEKTAGYFIALPNQSVRIDN